MHVTWVHKNIYIYFLILWNLVDSLTWIAVMWRDTDQIIKKNCKYEWIIIRSVSQPVSQLPSILLTSASASEQDIIIIFKYFGKKGAGGWWEFYVDDEENTAGQNCLSTARPGAMSDLHYTSRARSDRLVNDSYSHTVNTTLLDFHINNSTAHLYGGITLPSISAFLPLPWLTSSSIYLIRITWLESPESQI